MWRVMMGAAAATVVMAAPGKPEAREDTTQLAAEHRKPVVSVTPHPVNDLVDALLKSDTMSAVDEAAARITSAVGEVVEDLGDFVVGTVKDLPNTIREVSTTVNKAMTDGSERVEIIVKRFRTRLVNETAVASKSVTNTVDRVHKAANSSQTVDSFMKLQERIAVTMGRIFASFVFNLDKIDSAVADGIRQASSTSPGISLTPVRTRPSEENEIGKIA